ncbi:MAG: TMEM14 family protein [Parachlamydiaceae bacterium]|nr:TMEM14 family protein [Parachlamydiaceae bacterium]
MNYPALIVFVYGVLLLIGGIIGHLKANSMASLIAGTVFAVLTMASAVAIHKESTVGYYIAMGLSAFLTLFFAYRFSLSYNFMPSGLMTFLSLAVFLILFFTRKAN